MKSARRGAGTSQVEISGISRHGIWLYLEEREVFLPFKDFPWFRDAPVAGVLNVQRPQPHHLYWPDIDIDLALDSILHPERFPLISRERPKKDSQKATARPRSTSKTKLKRRRR